MTRPPCVGPAAAGSAAGRGGRSWLLAGLLVAVVLLAANHALVRGAAAPKWDGDEFFAPYFTLVADHARAGRILRWDPWSAGGSPDFADPQVGALSPLTVLVGAIAPGSEVGFRVYWLLLWLLGPLGFLALARHLGAPAWGGSVVALGFAFSGFSRGHRAGSPPGRLRHRRAARLVRAGGRPGHADRHGLRGLRAQGR